MSETLQLIEDSRSAESVLETYQVTKKVFLLGCLSSGVTIRKQQVRAYNLAYAMACSRRHEASPRIAVIGAGIAGLTFVVALMSLLPKAKVTMLERRTDICPLQQGAETRWVHPHIYDWPKVGSRKPSTEFPQLNWTEGSAAEVADTMLNQFGLFWSRICLEGKSETRTGQKSEPFVDPISLYISVSHLKVTSSTGQVEWVGTRGNLIGGHVVCRQIEGITRDFDSVVVASGFGLEDAKGSGTPSYWRNDTLGQPVLSGIKQPVVISGFGDGAIVDLCRITIERFRHGAIVKDLFGEDIHHVEKELSRLGAPYIGGSFQSFVENNKYVEKLVHQSVESIRKRLRKDVLAVMHLQGKEPHLTSVWAAFEAKSSFLNKFLMLILFRAGAFVPRFDALESVKLDYGIADNRVIIRHGAMAEDNVLGLFKDADMISSKLNDMQIADNQLADELWPPGKIPSIPRRT